MFTMIKSGCPSGYAYVRDFCGNLCYYGPVAECKKYIEYMVLEAHKMTQAIVKAWEGMLNENT